jgi:FMN phosphatase YigB (HAD superfamily)
MPSEQHSRWTPTDVDERSPVAAVLLDVGGTLWPDRVPVDLGVRIDRLLSAWPGLADQEAATFLERLQELAPIAEQGLTQDVHALLGEVARASGLDLGPGQVDVVRKALCVPAAGYIRLFDGVGSLLRTIRRLNLRCALVSNASVRSGDDYRADFGSFGLADLVDVFVSSIDLGVRKPDPGIFMAALKVLDCRADRAVIVGNSERNDIEPGRRLGTRTVRVAIEEPSPSFTAADTLVTDLRQVENLIQAWTDASSP